MGNPVQGVVPGPPTNLVGDAYLSGSHLPGLGMLEMLETGPISPKEDIFFTLRKSLVHCLGSSNQAGGNPHRAAQSYVALE